MTIVIGIVFQILFAIFFVFLCLSFITGAPYVPSTNTTSKKMIDMADLEGDEIIYDIGSGDGKLLFLAAKKGVKKAIGIEINPMLVMFTRIKAFFSRFRSKIQCNWGNFWYSSLHDADVIFVYLLPWKMDKLAVKLQKELKPGTKIVSNSFIFPHWPLVKSDKENHVYVFLLP